MPLSSKTVINHIRSYAGPFSRQDLVKDIIGRKTEIQKNKKKKSKQRGKKTAEYRPQKDTAKIDETLHVLLSAGFLSLHKKKYHVRHHFISDGKIIISTSGSGVFLSEDNTEIIVGKEDTKGANNNDLVSARLYDYRKGLFFGEVVKILKRDRNHYLARFSRFTGGMIIFRLIDLPGDIEVCLEQGADNRANKKLNDPSFLFIVSLTDRVISGRHLCEIIDSFSLDDEKNDLRRIVLKHSLPGPHKDYGDPETLRHSVDPHEMKDRKDYRNEFTITIDGANAKDFDDAISLKTGEDRTTLYVHIADVSAYVARDSDLDREAQNRGTSYYLGNAVIPMLPEILSNNLCSLRQGEDRLTMTAEMTFDGEGGYRGSSFHRGIIRVDHRLTYEGAEEILNSDDSSTLGRKLRQMQSLARILYERRLKTGRLDLNLGDEVVIYDGDRVKSIEFAERLNSHRLIEEFMLSANETVARFITEKEVPSLYRVHEEMSDEKFAALLQFLKVYNIKPPKQADSGPAIQDILARVAGKDYEHVVNLVVLKSMMQAYYGTVPLGHYGLGFRDYTHFTSPIRRYPDLIVHRSLKSILDGIAPPYTTESMDFIGEKSSELERIAQKAERDMLKLKSCRLMLDRKGEVFPAIISGVSRFGFFVTLKESPIEGMVPMRNLTDDYYLIMEDEYTIIGKKYSRRFRLGDSVSLRLTSVELETMRIDFEVA